MFEMRSMNNEHLLIHHSLLSSYIEGATDFIFGQYGQAWFDQCDIRVPSTTLGYITASGRASDDAGYYVINNSTVAAADGADVPSGSMYLGRPWGDYARVAFQNTELSDIINSAGWSIWNVGDERTDHVSFGEYDNTGDGSVGTRASFSSQLSEPVAIADVLGSDWESAYWVDSSYVS
jgi:pectinesterase